MRQIRTVREFAIHRSCSFPTPGKIDNCLTAQCSTKTKLLFKTLMGEVRPIVLDNGEINYQELATISNSFGISILKVDFHTRRMLMDSLMEEV